MAEIIADRYAETLAPKLVTATQAALNRVTDDLLGISKSVIPGETPGVAGPAVPLGPPSPTQDPRCHTRGARTSLTIVGDNDEDRQRTDFDA